MAIDSSLLGSSATAPLASRVTWPEQVSGFVRAKPLGVGGALIILVMLLGAAGAPGPVRVAGFARAKPLGVVGALIILVMLLVAAVAPALAPYDPYEPDYAAQLAPPAGEPCSRTARV